jgi:hypothetical protein
VRYGGGFRLPSTLCSRPVINMLST